MLVLTIFLVHARLMRSETGNEYAAMDDVVAVEVTLADGGLRYFVTWGRIQQTVDPEPVCKLVL